MCHEQLKPRFIKIIFFRWGGIKQIPASRFLFLLLRIAFISNCIKGKREREYKHIGNADDEKFSFAFHPLLPLNDPFFECDLCSLRFLSISSCSPLPSINHQITRFCFISILFENLHLSPYTYTEQRDI